MNYYVYKNRFMADGDTVQSGELTFTMSPSLADVNPILISKIQGRVIKKGGYYKCVNDNDGGFEKGKVYFSTGDGMLADENDVVRVVTDKMAYELFAPSDFVAYRECGLIKRMNTDYKKGCMFIRNGVKYTSTSDPSIQRGGRKENIKFTVFCLAGDDMIYLYSDERNLNWPSLVEHIFVTADGRNASPGEVVYELTESLEVKPVAVTDKMVHHDGRFFFHESNALDLKRGKALETLTAVETSLLRSERIRYDEDPESSSIRLTDGIFYRWLKAYDPHAYWRKVLEVIGETLNGGWTPEWGLACNTKHVIQITGVDEQSNEVKYKVNEIYTIREDLVYFKSREAARMAIDIMGGYLRYVFSII